MATRMLSSARNDCSVCLRSVGGITGSSDLKGVSGQAELTPVCSLAHLLQVHDLRKQGFRAGSFIDRLSLLLALLRVVID